MSGERVYLDYSATTPLDPRVLDAMLPYFEGSFGNPSSVHYWGQQAEAGVEGARARIAALLSCTPEEIVFTSGGSESDNLALRGLAFAGRERRGANHILTTPVEHEAVLKTARELASRHGFELELLPVDRFGQVSPAVLQARLRPDTAFVSILYGNNEIGTVNDLASLGAICRRAGVPIHTDAVQAGSQLPLDVKSLHVDLLTLSAHKFYGPKGVGLLYLRRGTPIVASQTGGGHESGLRAGTHNVPGIVGMAEALLMADEEREVHSRRLTGLRNEIITRTLADVEDSQLTGHPEARLANHASFVFHGVDGNELLAALDLAGFACSSGSACKTGLPEPSETLLALGLDREWALGSLRVTLGRPTTAEEVEGFLDTLPVIVSRMRRAEAVAR